jgi:hypothetical protein
LNSVPAPVGPAIFYPNGVYRRNDLMHMLGVPMSGVRRAVREDGLRRSKRGNRYYFLGQWVLDWIAAGEIKRRPPAPPAAAS